MAAFEDEIVERNPEASLQRTGEALQWADAGDAACAIQRNLAARRAQRLLCPNTRFWQEHDRRATVDLVGDYEKPARPDV